MTGSLIQYIVPESTVNVILNPSVEITTTGYLAAAGAAISRYTASAARGSACLQILPTTAITDGAVYAISLTPATVYTWSVDVSTLAVGAVAYRILVQDVTASSTVAQLPFSQKRTDGWQRYTLTFTTTANTSFRLFVQKNNTADTSNFYLDGMQLEQKAYATSYTDGDMDGGAWSGARHASISTRSAQYRGGGRLTDPLTAWNAGLVGMAGTGLPPLQHIATDYGQVDGAEFQRVQVKQRVFTLTYRIVATSMQDLHTKRLGFINAVKKDLVSPEQPVRVQYLGGTQPVELQAYYDDGFQFARKLDGFSEEVQLRFLADNPYWQTTYTSSKALALNETIADANYVLERRSDGTWHALGSGFDGQVLAVLNGLDGYLYAGGSFTTAYNGAGSTSPVTVNHIARWDGTQWAPLGAGTNAQVRTLAIDGAGLVYLGGDFTDGSYPYVAVWNGTTLAQLGTGSFNASVFAVLYNPHDGRVYIGGSFTNFGGTANQNDLIAWNTSTAAFESLGLNTSASVRCFAYDRVGSVVAGGTFTSIAGTSANRIAIHKAGDPLTTWSAIPAGTGNGFNNQVNSVAFDTANSLYVGGTFTDAAYPFLAKQVGNTFVPLGKGVNNQITVIQPALTGSSVFIGGLFTSAGGLGLADKFAVWNGSGWGHTYADLPGAATVFDVALMSDGRIALGYNTAGSATTSNITDTTIGVNGSREAAPAIFLHGPGQFQMIQNTTTGKTLTFNNLTLQLGEYAVLNLDPIGFYFHTNLRGNIANYILPGSDIGSWRLQPGLNTVLVKAASTTGASFLSVIFRERFWSLDQ